MEMKAWFWIWAGITFSSLSHPVRLLHNWPGAENAMAGISAVWEEDWLDALEGYYQKDVESETAESGEEAEPTRERMADVELPPKKRTLSEPDAEGPEEGISDEDGILPEEEVIESSGPEAEVVAAPSNRWGIRLSQEEIDLLACIVWVEARGEPDAGQQAVAEVVFNRMAHGSFPGTLYEVVSERSGGYLQFTSWKYVSSAAPTEKEYRNIQAVLDGQTAYTNNNTVYFSTSPQTRNITCVIGGHYFCE